MAINKPILRKMAVPDVVKGTNQPMSKADMTDRNALFESRIGKGGNLGGGGSLGGIRNTGKVAPKTPEEIRQAGIERDALFASRIGTGGNLGGGGSGAGITKAGATAPLTAEQMSGMKTPSGMTIAQAEAHQAQQRAGVGAGAETGAVAGETPKDQRTLIDIYNERTDVQADLEKRFPGQDPLQQGTEANTALNDWWNQYGSKEFSDVELTQPELVGTSDSARDAEDKADADKVVSEEEELINQNREIQRLQNETLLKQLQAGLEDPVDVPSFEDVYATMRSEMGLTAIEKGITDIDAEIAELDASQRKGEFREEGRMAPMGIIQGRQREIQRQGAEQRNDLLREKAILVDQQSTAINAIDTIMKFQQLDYQNASDKYNKEFQQALQLQDALRAGRAEERTEKAIEKSEEEKLREIASANAQVYINNLTEAGISFDDASPEVQNALTKEIVKAGMDVSVVRAFMNAIPDAKLLSTVQGVDASGNDIVTFMYADKDGKPGAIEVVKTGGYTRPGGSGTKPSSAEIFASTKQGFAKNIDDVAGEDGYISPQNWAKARKDWTTNTSYTSKQFDDTYRGYINPADPYDYAGFESESAGFKKTDSSDEARFIELDRKVMADPSTATKEETAEWMRLQL